MRKEALAIKKIKRETVCAKTNRKLEFKKEKLWSVQQMKLDILDNLKQKDDPYTFEDVDWYLKCTKIIDDAKKKECATR